MMLMFHDSKAPVGSDYIYIYIYLYIYMEIFRAEIPHQLMVVVYPSAKNWFNLCFVSSEVQAFNMFQPSPIVFVLSIGFCLQLNHKFCVLLNRSG